MGESIGASLQTFKARLPYSFMAGVLKQRLESCTGSLNRAGAQNGAKTISLSRVAFKTVEAYSVRKTTVTQIASTPLLGLIGMAIVANGIQRMIQDVRSTPTVVKGSNVRELVKL